MNRVNALIAMTLALAAGAHTAVRAADTNAPVVQAHAQISKVSAVRATLKTGWYGPGSDGGFGYYNPARTPQYNPYPFYNLIGGEAFGPQYTYSLPDQNESPFNPPAALTKHKVASPNHGAIVAPTLAQPPTPSKQ